jgi:Ni,Fe-hydrogenase III large subunit
MPLADGHRLAGRVSGDSTVAYAWAYAMAAEAASGCAIPPRAAWLRALLLERERVANHLGDLGALGNDGGLAFGLAQFSRLRELWQRTSAAIFGHRLLMDRIVPGGVAMDPSRAGLADVRAQCRELREEVNRLRSIYDEHAGLQDRFLTAGIVTPELAAQLGLTGSAARASGWPGDLRVDFPCPPYGQLAVQAAMEVRGDVAARVTVRFDEVFESLRLIEAIVDGMPDGPVRVDLPRRSEPGFGIGWVEGWRGDVLVALEVDAEGRLQRCHCHDPSWQNWPLLEHAVIGNIVPDFPLINKSFNLSYSGQDL